MGGTGNKTFGRITRAAGGAPAVVVSAVLATLAACAAPSLEVTTAPPNTRLLIDGRVRPGGEFESALPYYGVFGVDAVQPLAALSADDRPRDAVHRLVSVPEPFSPWVFPFDFVLEVAATAWSGPQRHTLRVELPESNEPLVSGVAPARIDEIRERGRAITLER